MTAANYTMTCEQGANFNLVITWKDTSGNPINNTDYTANMEVRKEPNIDPVVTLSTANNRILLGGTNGKITLNLLPADTHGIKPTDYFYDLDLIDSSGSVSRVLEGIFSVKRQITQ